MSTAATIAEPAFIDRYGEQYGEFLRTIRRERRAANDALAAEMKVRVDAVIACRDAGLIAREEEAAFFVSVARWYELASVLLERAEHAVQWSTGSSARGDWSDPRWPLVKGDEKYTAAWNRERQRDSLFEPGATLERKAQLLRAVVRGHAEGDATLAICFAGTDTE